MPIVAVFTDNFHLQTAKNGLYRLFAYSLANQRVHTRDIEGYGERIETGLPVVAHLHRHLSACNFLYKQGAAFQYIQGVVRVATTLIAE